MMFRNLTGYVIDSLPQSCNLTDGQAFGRWFAAVEAIIDPSEQLFKSANRQLQDEIERQYIRDSSQLAKQS